MSEPTITVGQNNPRSRPAERNGQATAAPSQPLGGPVPFPGAAPARYWTPDRAEHAIAYACRALVPIAGPNMRATEFELDMGGAPLAAVLHEIWPLPSSESAPLQVNLLVLCIVLAFMALVRLPDILKAVEKYRRGQLLADQRAAQAEAAGPDQVPPVRAAQAAPAPDRSRRPDLIPETHAVGTGHIGR